MCERYAFFAGKEKTEDFFGISGDAALFDPHFNVAHGAVMPAIWAGKARMKCVGPFTWGLDCGPGNLPKPYVKAEELHENGDLKRIFRRQRCIIPASGFMEWQEVGSFRIPYYVRALDQEVIGFAGIYDRAGEEGNYTYSFSLITVPANDLIQPMDERMPAILRKPMYDNWIDPLYDDMDRLAATLKSYPTDRMALYRIGRAIDDLSNDGPDLLKPEM